MSRVACLLLSDVPLAAAIRAEPELRGAKLCITSDRDIVSGWLRGLTVEQARTIEPDLIVRPLSIEGMHSAQEALMDVALSVTPRVEDGGTLLQTGQSGALLDLAGTSALFPSERGLLTALDTRLHAVGLDGVRCGIGSTRVVAELAALYRDGGQIVKSADEVSFLQATCRKAGLEEDAWEHDTVEVFRFQGRELKQPMDDLLAEGEASNRSR